jgi:acyl-coenzyme A thioesterase PaaI-like protein
VSNDAEPTAAPLNPAGTVHGGLSVTLLDSCMGLAVHSKLDTGSGQTTLEFKISRVRALTPAEGSVVFRRPGISTTEGPLNDSEGAHPGAGHNDLFDL